MNFIGRKVVCVGGLALAVCLVCGCAREAAADRSDDLTPPEDLGQTIGSLVRVTAPAVVKVEGYGLVSGLKGTGSAECPPRIRAYLGRYIRKQLPAESGVNVDEYINRSETAVVFVEGIMPALASHGEYFDVLVTALPGTQTTSLDGGWLFETELKMEGSFGVATKIMADAKGPLYTDKIGDGQADNRMGHVMAGGKVLSDYQVALTLLKPDFTLSNAIRDRLNWRFGRDTARAVAPGQVEVTVPVKFRRRKDRFVAMVGAMFLRQDPQLDEKRIEFFVKRLAETQDKFTSEVALEAIGNKCLGKLGALLNSPDELARVHAARCMLSLASNAGLTVLRQVALDKNSPYRLDALVAVAVVAEQNTAAGLCRMLLRDDNFLISLAAYEQLREMGDISITQEQVAGNFYIERLAQPEQKTIFVYRTGQPRVVLFGSPIMCRGNIFLGSAEGDITINAPSGAEYVTIIRKHPKRPNVVTQLRSSFEVGDIVRTLCDNPPKEDEPGRGGLGVSYADAVLLLKEMCDKRAVDAEFRAGPMPNFGPIIKK